MRRLWGVVKAIFRWLWGALTFVRTAMNNIIFLGTIVAMAAMFSLWHSGTNQPVSIKPGALLVDLSGSISDDLPLSSQSRGLLHRWLAKSPVVGNSLFEVVNAIRQAKTDNNIKGVVLALQNFDGANQPALRYIGKALSEFRASGKPIYAVGNSYTQDQYYLASFADNISLAPSGSVDLYGFSRRGFYYKSLLEKLKVTTHVFRVGAYKSAVEPLLRDDMSSEVRADSQQRLNTSWQRYLTDIAENRQLATAVLSPENSLYIDTLKRLQGDSAQYALKNRLVDQLATAHETHEALIAIFGKQAKTESFNAVSIYNYLPKEEQQAKHGQGMDALPHIAVVIANGPLIYGMTKPGSVGSETTVNLLRQACYNDKIKAVILHINSPGGSVQASEAIHSQLAALKRAGKPVVVSMGGAAASGGYWIATAADYIVAGATTLTGSIGIFGIINTFEKTFDHIGLHTDGVATSPLADFSSSKPLSPPVAQIIQITIDKGYRNFIELVATARHKTLAEVEAMAQGRVWLGIDAHQKGLVDQIGDFDDAIAKAAELAQLETYRLRWLTQQPSEWLEYLFGVENVRSIKVATTRLSTPLLQTVVEYTQDHLMNYFNDPQGCYAFCDNCQFH